MGMQLDFSMLKPMDILDLAISVEEEARAHYEQLASWAESRGGGPVVDFLHRMAGLEELHRSQLAELRQKRFGDTPRNYTENLAWDVESPDYDSVGPGMTLKQALELARDAEMRAYEYYTEAGEYLNDPEALELIARLRDSELDHKRLLEEQIARLGE